MKKILLLGLALLVPITFSDFVDEAHAYSSNVGNDPDTSDTTGLDAEGDLETRQYKKSTTAGQSEAIVKGTALRYADVNDGYTMTRAFAQTVAGHRRLACIALDDVATGDTNYHRCATKGYMKIRYDILTTGQPIEAGQPVCFTGFGIAAGCAQAGGGLATSPMATANGRAVMPLENKLTGQGVDLKVILNLQ